MAERISHIGVVSEAVGPIHTFTTFDQKEVSMLRRGMATLLRDPRYPSETELTPDGWHRYETGPDAGWYGPPDGLTRERIQLAYGKLQDPHSLLEKGDLYTLSTGLLRLTTKLKANGRQGWTHPELARLEGKVYVLRGLDNPNVQRLLNAGLESKPKRLSEAA